jgi:hypothetical protein
VASDFESLDAEIRALLNARHETVVIMSKPRKETHLLCPNWRMMYRPVSLKRKEKKTKLLLDIEDFHAEFIIELVNLSCHC